MEGFFHHDSLNFSCHIPTSPCLTAKGVIKDVVPQLFSSRFLLLTDATREEGTFLFALLVGEFFDNSRIISNPVRVLIKDIGEHVCSKQQEFVVIFFRAGDEHTEGARHLDKARFFHLFGLIVRNVTTTFAQVDIKNFEGAVRPLPVIAVTVTVERSTTFLRIFTFTPFRFVGAVVAAVTIFLQTRTEDILGHLKLTGIGIARHGTGVGPNKVRTLGLTQRCGTRLGIAFTFLDGQIQTCGTAGGWGWSRWI
mmetsp:Transcript_44583/g.48236  ORF Transcript_44583/g.48236 Transcript_44583/m.48236 type:complete len:252 (+) Transcript_44583:594-1349(+)